MGSLDRFGPLGKNAYATIEGIRDPIRRKTARHESSYEEHVQNRNLKAEKLIALLEKKKNVASRNSKAVKSHVQFFFNKALICS